MVEVAPASSGPGAGRLHQPEAFEFDTNTATCVEAIDVAWTRIGAVVLDRCGPIDWIDVTGTRKEAGRQ